MAADSTSQDKYVQWNVFASIQKGFEEEQDMKEVCIFIEWLVSIVMLRYITVAIACQSERLGADC